MNTNDMLLEAPSVPSTSGADRKVATSKVTTLNPEASVFQYPPEPRVRVGYEDLTESCYMNGDVSHNICGNNIPVEESHSDKSRNMMDGELCDMPTLQDESTSKESSTHLAENVNEDCEPSKSETSIPNVSDDTGQDSTVEASGESEEPLSTERVKSLLLDGVALFFSRENWSSDPYLLSQMDPDQYVPVHILAGCIQFANITKDQMLIFEALRESEFVQLDEEKGRVRPNYKRCIVILREIPESTPAEEIEALFDHKDCPKVISCEFVNNGSWYITFDNDDDAQKAYSYLRETVRIFKDKPILARIKTKPISRQGCFNVLPSKSGVTKVSNHGPSVPVLPNQGQTGGCMPLSGSTQPYPQRMVYPTAPQYIGFQGSLPPAIFYPNQALLWNHPNVYDFNGFIQYNGLSPKGTYKPVNNKFRSRTKKEEKSEGGRHASGGSTTSTSNRAGHANQSMESPHHDMQQHSHDEDHSQISYPNDMSNLTGDPLYSYTSINRPDVSGSLEGDRPVPIDSLAVHTVAGPNESTVLSPSQSCVHPQPHSFVVPPSQLNNLHFIPPRNGYLNEHHRSISRGGRHKRIGRQEEGTNGSSQIHRNGYQRSVAPSTAERSSFNDRRKPQFDLQASSFPPLPGADETHNSEKKPAGDSHKFSDVMKGTAKLKSEKSQEKEDVPLSASIPVSGHNMSSQNDESLPVAVEATANPASHPAQTPFQCNLVKNEKVSEKETRPVKSEKKSRNGGGNRDFQTNNGRHNKKDHRQFGKEIRPESETKSWRETKKEDGWITKGAKDVKQAPSETNVTKTKPMVNGDQAPAANTKKAVTNSEGNDKKVCQALPANAPDIEKKVNCNSKSLSPEVQHKTSWANMARSGKNEMEKLSAELKEKDEQERQKKIKVANKGPQNKPPVVKEKVIKKETTVVNDKPAADTKPASSAWTSKRPKTPPK